MIAEHKSWEILLEDIIMCTDKIQICLVILGFAIAGGLCVRTLYEAQVYMYYS